MTRGRVLMAVLICALLVAGCAAATWFSAPVTTAGGTAVVTVSGFEAFPVLERCCWRSAPDPWRC